MLSYNFKSNTVKIPKIKNVFNWVGKYWFQLIVCFFLFHIYQNINVQVVVSPASEKGLVSQYEKFSILPASNSSGEAPQKTAPVEKAEKDSYTINPSWKGTDFRNLSFILNPTLAKRKGVEPKLVEEKLAYCKDYVQRYSKTAVTEMEKYGIPASIKLAQGLLETDAGASRLANESNNHFGIKCRSKCRGCTCRNYADDDVYDMFRVFDSVWKSYREHSKLLQISRYAHLKNLGTKDYEAWAKGLKKAGYATDKNYHKKLIRIIEVLELHRFDQ